MLNVYKNMCMWRIRKQREPVPSVFWFRLDPVLSSLCCIVWFYLPLPKAFKTNTSMPMMAATAMKGATRAAIPVKPLVFKLVMLVMI